MHNVHIYTSSIQQMYSEVYACRFATDNILVMYVGASFL